MTTSHGAPVDSKTSTMTVGPRGPVLIQDNVFIDEMAHFDRERIPERVVHAKGAGAFGEFVVTHDITKFSKAVPFSIIGKKTPVAVRFSTVGMLSLLCYDFGDKILAQSIGQFIRNATDTIFKI